MNGGNKNSIHEEIMADVCKVIIIAEMHSLKYVSDANGELYQLDITNIALF